MICRIFISTVYLLLFFNLYHDFLFFFDASYTFNSSSACPPIRYSAPILKMVIIEEDSQECRETEQE